MSEPDADGWTRNRIAFRIHVEDAAVYFDMPWLVPDRNPFPRFRLFRRADNGAARRATTSPTNGNGSQP